MKRLKQIVTLILAKVLYPLARLYWFVFRPKTYGVKCMVRSGNDVLLIRNTYGKRLWTFPGGGIRKGETAELAVSREVFEEVGVSIRGAKKIGEFYTTVEYKRDFVKCFLADVTDKSYLADTTEIFDARWFSLSALPKLSPYAQRLLKMYRGHTQNGTETDLWTSAV